MEFRSLFFPAFPALTVGAASGQDALKYRFQLYQEEGDRIGVESHYLDYEHRWGKTKASVRLAIDTLSGMTPTGTHAVGDDTDFLFQQIDDERKVVVATIEHEVDDYTLSFEYAHSEEEDYRSNAVTARVSRQFNQKNTTVTGGVSFAFDEVLASPTGGTSNFEDEDKDTFDLSVGVSQILGPNTLLDFNAGYGRSEGYLSDPYRRISQIRDFVVISPFGGEQTITNTLNFAENRPDEQDRFVAKLNLRHYFEQAGAALNGSYRFFANNHGLQGHTFELKWIQQVNPQLSVTPYLRYYRQSAADFYFPTLTGTGIDGTGLIDGSGENYSSDYRISEQEALTYGVRMAWELRSNVILDLQVERYEINGLDSDTPDSFFPTANVISAGIQWSF